MAKQQYTTHNKKAKDWVTPTSQKKQGRSQEELADPSPHSTPVQPKKIHATLAKHVKKILDMFTFSLKGEIYFRKGMDKGIENRQ